jgi:hypothetical protein
VRLGLEVAPELEVEQGLLVQPGLVVLLEPVVQLELLVRLEPGESLETLQKMSFQTVVPEWASDDDDRFSMLRKTHSPKSVR